MFDSILFQKYNNFMSKTTIPYLIDETLNSTNATGRGYRFVADVIDPYESVRELIELAEKEGYTFGIPTKTNNSPMKIGLYKKEE
jgi:hypothetical protein